MPSTPRGACRSLGLLLVHRQHALGDKEAAEDVHTGEDQRDEAFDGIVTQQQRGDLGNAGYWYRQAGQPVAKDSLEAEWERIVSALLGSGKA